MTTTNEPICWDCTVNDHPGDAHPAGPQADAYAPCACWCTR